MNEIKEALRNKLTTSSDRYEELQLVLLEHNIKQEKAHKRLKRHEIQIGMNIYNESLDGKKVYTNDKMRDAAIQIKKENDNLFKDYDKDYTDLTNEIKKILMELDILNFQQRNNLKLVDIELSKEGQKDE